MYMTGLTEFIDVKQLDGNADVTLTGPPNLFPTAVHSHMYSKLCGIF